MRCGNCGVSIPSNYAPVSIGRRHGFCGKRCRDSWAVDRVMQLETALNRIFIRSRGRARKLALDALAGNV